jgi:23S rRNA (adenine2503-C2)-methyltransferase
MAGQIAKVDLKDLLKEELVNKLNALGVEKFRAEQVLNWIYKKNVCDLDAMTNLAPELKGSLKERFYISCLKLARELTSKDGTRKFLFELEDGERIESVFIPSKNTSTVCASSQVGCKFACAFCASGKGGFVRNLRPAEIINQVLYIKTPHPAPSPQRGEGWGEGVTNVVFMGMGEPLDNYEAVLKAVRILNAPYGLGIGQRKITISTCGLVPQIKRLSKEGLQIELSVSLHSANDKMRSGIMGVNNRYPLKELIAALKGYIKETGRQVTFEYVVINGINDSARAAQELAGLIKDMLAPTKAGLAKVNLIQFNPVDGLDYSVPSPQAVKEFKNTLDKRGVISVIRATRGDDISAACGQLRRE